VLYCDVNLCVVADGQIQFESLIHNEYVNLPESTGSPRSEQTGYGFMPSFDGSAESRCKLFLCLVLDNKFSACLFQF